ncbi:hypothetical protein M426DRAFT_9159 [Hypoxylon sp. CI-4A]|nr:hypothetical protein M426DRAFT_9159 [Hypoxylon sp. CI-4A]
MEFLPERFIVVEGHPLHPVKNAWRLFELWNTRCIGEELAMIEMKLVGRTTPLDSVGREYVYRVSGGIGSVKDKLPTRIKLHV